MNECMCVCGVVVAVAILELVIVLVEVILVVSGLIAASESGLPQSALTLES